MDDKKNKFPPLPKIDCSRDGTTCDITDEVNDKRARYKRILEHSFEEIYVFDCETLLFSEVSQGALKNLGYTLDEMKGMTPLDVKPEFTRAEFIEMIQPLRTFELDILRFQTTHLRKDGSTYEIEVRLQFVNGNESVIIAMITDITERKRYEEELKALAFRDPGTDLYNRRFFLEQMEGTIHNANRTKTSVGLILLDMDDFSVVNNTYGHVAGDAIIVDFAEKIRSVFSRKTDVVARYGGDEFVVSCLDNKKEDLLKKCADLVHLFNKPCVHDGNEIIQTASVGICFSSGEKCIINTNELIEGADIAMYEVKEAGKNSYRLCK